MTFIVLLLYIVIHCILSFREICLDSLTSFRPIMFNCNSNYIIV